MNPHVLQGTVAFVLWSIFSTWYYVNHVKDWPDENNDPKTTSTPLTVESKNPEPKPEPTEQKTELKMAIDYSTTIFFELNSSSPVTSTPMDIFLDSLKKLPDDRPFQLSIIGQTCDLGSTTYNDSLSKVRANVVEQYLRPSVWDNLSITVIGNGENSPIFPNNSEENRAKNRRVDIHLTN